MVYLLSYITFSASLPPNRSLPLLPFLPPSPSLSPSPSPSSQSLSCPPSLPQDPLLFDSKDFVAGNGSLADSEEGVEFPKTTIKHGVFGMKDWEQEEAEEDSSDSELERKRAILRFCSSFRGRFGWGGWWNWRRKGEENESVDSDETSSEDEERGLEGKGGMELAVEGKEFEEEEEGEEGAGEAEDGRSKEREKREAKEEEEEEEEEEERKEEERKIRSCRLLLFRAIKSFTFEDAVEKFLPDPQDVLGQDRHLLEIEREWCVRGNADFSSCLSVAKAEGMYHKALEASKQDKVLLRQDVEKAELALQMSIDEDHNFVPSLLSYCELLLLKQENRDSTTIVEMVLGRGCAVNALRRWSVARSRDDKRREGAGQEGESRNDDVGATSEKFAAARKGGPGRGIQVVACELGGRLVEKTKVAHLPPHVDAFPAHRRLLSPLVCSPSRQLRANVVCDWDVEVEEGRGGAGRTCADDLHALRDEAMGRSRSRSRGRGRREQVRWTSPAGDAGTAMPFGEHVPLCRPAGGREGDGAGGKFSVPAGVEDQQA
eukprot:765409-Hanusia_phi.AAC.2